jgi:multicomponent Na+:H+ antiporter subunit A
MEAVYFTVFLPLLAGCLLLAFPEKWRTFKNLAALVVIALSSVYAYILFRADAQAVSLSLPGFLGPSEELNRMLVFAVDPLSKVCTLFIGFFSLVILVYSFSYLSPSHRVKSYPSYFIMSSGAAAGAVLTDHFLVFLFFWGILGFTLYRLISGFHEGGAAAAKKTFIMIGASDTLMIIGIALLRILGRSYQLSAIRIEAGGALPAIAFLTLLLASMTKAGAFPVHTWIPDYAENAPASSSAFLPASLDKLLGIYFLARICLSLFRIHSWMTLLLILVGVVTIITAVMMALVQHNYKRLLGYHAVSQVGYMVLGLGLGTPLGIAGGLFHMLNHALYKSGLFLTAGSVEKRTGKNDLGEVGGLSGQMPLTFACALVFALSISGIPPFNGFASKWMIYQACIEFGRGAGLVHQLWMVWLGLAVLGSALTLASFAKWISGIFLGRKRPELSGVKEVGFFMGLPQFLLALVCIVFGVAAASFAVPVFVSPAAGSLVYTGIWPSQAVMFLILVSILLGLAIYWALRPKKFRTEESFIGGESVQEDSSFSVLEFYKTISGFKGLSFFYRKAEEKRFDVYELTKNGVLRTHSIFSRFHSGVLSSYLIWVIAGLVAVFLFLWMRV